MFRRLIVALLPALLLAATSAHAGRQQPLTLPDPIAIPSDVTPQQVQRAIKIALIGRTWTITREQPGRIEATLNIRAHSARIMVDYDARQISFHHVDSVNLMEETRKGQRVIHRNYISWLQNVAGDIRLQLQMANL